MTANNSSGAALRIDALEKRYGDKLVVNGVHLDIIPGEFITFLGPSGSGKTTTLNMIAGFAGVDAGEILLDGRPIDNLPPHKRDIGMVFQNYALFPHMTVRRNIEFPLARRGVAKARRLELVEQALSMVRLEGLGGRYPRQLSGGQQQRVALARAIVFSPRLLLMDEPLGALDKNLREWLQTEIRRIHRELGITFVYVTHDQEEALILSDRIAVFNEGRIEQVGTAEDLYERPETLFVAQFIGETNVFAGRASPEGDKWRVNSPVGSLLATSRGALSVDDRPTLVVRPERLRLGDHSELGRNFVRGTVREVLYLGADRRVIVDLSDGTSCALREPASAAASVSPGDTVNVSWRVDDGLLVPAGSGSDVQSASAHGSAATLSAVSA